MDKKRISCTIVAALSTCAMLAGCDRPPSPTQTSFGRPIKSMAVPQDPELHEAIRDSEAARANYRYRIEVLKGYYDRIGNADKYSDANKELKNLSNAQWFRWEGFEEVAPPAGEDIAKGDETALIEELMGARKTWTDALGKVEGIYRQKNLIDQANTIKRVQERIDPVRLPTYHVAAEIPPATLRPTAVIPEADELYNRAYKLFREGKGPIPLFTTRYSKEREALELFKQVVRQYPSSDKIALCAYYIGDIYKEYFNENTRAVLWYQRSWEWSENKLTEPAYFQCATVYERMSDWNNAVMCYRNSLKYDPDRPLNAEYARLRLKDLTGKEE